MKYNQKGFTLIELLAVIVILAIIALITTPIIMNVINDSRKKAAVDSAYGVIDAVKNAYSLNQMESNAQSGDQTITFNGSSVPTIGSREISLSGETPKGGTAIINASTGVIELHNLQIAQFYCNTITANGQAHAKVCCSTSTDCTTE